MKSIEQLLSIKLQETELLGAKAKKSLEKAPEGSLIISFSGQNMQYYHRTKKEQKKGAYISKENKKLISALAQKQYDQAFLKTAEENIKKLRKILKLLPIIELTDVYAKLSLYRKSLVKPYIMTDEQYVEQWLNVKYTGKEFNENMPWLVTERGERVRSKTEKILADKFYSMGIPYRYEYPVKIKGYGLVYPDFILLNVSTRKEIYMEHFGMMDKQEYCQNAINKLESYARNGIYPGKNLLVTFETSQHPLNMKMVEALLKEFIMT